MGHATHFLQRLDRVNELEVELALTLYRDPQLLKAVLSSVELPAKAERFALSLGDPVNGPFVVLTRTGHFVTCLGEGMRVGDLPVMTRAQLDVAAGRVQRMRDEIDRVKQLLGSGGEGEMMRLLRTLAAAGPRFCREDAQGLGMVAPLIAPWITELMARMIRTVLSDMPLVAVLRPKKLAPRERDFLLEYGRMVWVLANALPLVSLSETRQLNKHVGDNLRALVEYNFAAGAFELFTVVHGHRALWVMARAGKDGLALAHQPPRPGEGAGRRAFRELALAAVAFGSPSLRMRALHKLSADENDEDMGAYVAGVLRNGVFKDAEQASAIHADGGRELLRVALRKAGTPDADAMEIPDDLAHAIAATSVTNWLAGPEEFCELQLLCTSLPWLARAPLDQLYLPRAWLDRLLPELSVESIETWLTPTAQVHRFGRPATVRRDAPKPERNAACACGSGKKWKRCCGLRAVARVWT
jgi:hypothetical protein